MRKYYRLSLRLFGVVTLSIIFYISQTTFEIEDLRSSFPNDHDIQLTDKTNKGMASVYRKNEENEKRRENMMKTDEVKISQPVQSVIESTDAAIRVSQLGKTDVMKKNDPDKVKNSQRRPLKLPPFVGESPDDGPGEHGKPLELILNPEEEKESKRLYALNDFNQYISDRISVHRRLDDTRIPGCKDMTYPQNLPKTSVIICFHNEAWSVLLRSVHSILDRSPPELIREIILVDDFSTMDHLKGPLDQYMGELEKVKIVRATRREGLIRARLLGYDVATGPVLVFLDSHIECFPGWLEPMLARIAEDPKVVVFPQIPVIDKNTFSAATAKRFAVGSFNWASLTFRWVRITPGEIKRRKRDTEPIRSPTMPGGLFAIDKQWFTTLGTYDQQLDYWGGENIELSFKSWMCNGSIELIPCSHVGHIFRSNNPIKWSVSGATAKNSIRVAEVWMDEYKETFFDLSYPKTRYDFGDVSDRKRLRESLHCHNFKWYLDNVLEFIPPKILARGEIRSLTSPQCLDSMGNKKSPELYPCHGAGLNQRWVFTEDNRLLQGLHNALCYQGKRLRINGCHQANNIWRLDYGEAVVQHSQSGLCLERRFPNKLTMAKCDDSKNQRWLLPTWKRGLSRHNTSE